MQFIAAILAVASVALAAPDEKAGAVKKTSTEPKAGDRKASGAKSASEKKPALELKVVPSSATASSTAPLQPASGDKKILSDPLLNGQVGEIAVPFRESAGANPAPLSDPALNIRRKPAPLGPIVALPSQKRIEVTVGMFYVLTSYSPIRVVAVGDPLVADVQVLSSRAVLVNGKKPGVTNLVVWEAGGIARQHEVVVSGLPRSLIDEVKQALAMPEVKVRILRDSLVLEGEVKDEETRTRAKLIAALFSDKVGNLLTIPEAAARGPKLADTLKQVRAVLSPMGIEAEMVGERVVIKGTVDTEDMKTRAEALAKQFAPDAINLIELRPYSAEELQTAIGLPKVIVRVVRDQVILDGDVENAEQATAAASIASKSGKTVVNRLVIPKPPLPPPPPPVKSMAQQIQEAINAASDKPTIRVRGVGAPMAQQGPAPQAAPTSIVLEGEVTDITEAERAYRIAKSYFGGGSIDTTLLIVTQAPLINLEMSIMEINRDKAKQLGITIPPLGTAAGPFVFGERGGGVPNSPIVRQTPLTVNFQALATSTAARILSNPNFTVLSGRVARFQVGGQVPIPVLSTTGTGVITQSVEFRDFGLIVDMLPTLMSNGTIAMDLRTTVSSVDDGLAAVIGNTRVPGFANRTFSTIVRVGDGGFVGIAGLIDRHESLLLNRIPIVSSIPVLGKLFTSRTFRRTDNELIIFIRPKTTGEAIPQPYVPTLPFNPVPINLPAAAGAAGGAGGGVGGGGVPPG